MLHLGLLVWYHCSVRIQVLTVFKSSQHKTWRITTTTAGCTSVSLKISINKQQFSVDVSDKLLPTLNITLRYYSNKKYNCFSASWSFLELGGFKVEKLLLVMKNKMEKTSAVIPSFLYPQDVYNRISTASEKILFCVIPCQVQEFSKANGESFCNLMLFVWVSKKFSNWTVLLKGGVFKDFSYGTSEAPNRGSWMNAENSLLLLEVFSAWLYQYYSWLKGRWETNYMLLYLNYVNFHYN